MNKEIIQLKLERLRRCVERIREKTPDTAEALLGDDDLQEVRQDRHMRANKASRVGPPKARRAATSIKRTPKKPLTDTAY